MNKISLSTLLLMCLLTAFSHADSPKITVVNRLARIVRITGVPVAANDLSPISIQDVNKWMYGIDILPGNKFELKKAGENFALTINDDPYLAKGIRFSVIIDERPIMGKSVGINIDPASYSEDTTLLLTQDGSNVKVTPLSE